MGSRPFSVSGSREMRWLDLNCVWGETSKNFLNRKQPGFQKLVNISFCIVPIFWTEPLEFNRYSKSPRFHAITWSFLRGFDKFNDNINWCGYPTTFRIPIHLNDGAPKQNSPYVFFWVHRVQKQINQFTSKILCVEISLHSPRAARPFF